MLGIKLDVKFAWDAAFYCIIGLLFIVSIAAYLPARKAAKLTVSHCLSR
jgi:ABC-type lipoprotein release transport system permease subunit